MVQHRDPLVDALLRLGKATDFRQPAEGGVATTRAQVTRNLRPYNRDAASLLVAAFHGPEDAHRRRASAQKARELSARTAQEVEAKMKAHSAMRILELRRARLREQEQALDQLAAQVKSQIPAALEDQAKLTRLQQEQQQQRERARCLMLAHSRGRRLRPILESFAEQQRHEIQAVRARMMGDTGDLGSVEKVGHLCTQVQQELWMQLNAASMAAASAATVPTALMLTGGGDSEGFPSSYAGALSAGPFGSGCGGSGGGHPAASLEPHLHLPRASLLQRQVMELLQLPPQKLVMAVYQLGKSSRNNLTVLLGGWDLLADARNRCQALGGAAVDPLHDVRKLQQAELDSITRVWQLEVKTLACKTRLLELAAMPAVCKALNQSVVAARIQLESRRVMAAASRAALEALARDAVQQEKLVEEVGRLEATAFELEREERRLESLVTLLTAAQAQVVTEWQQQYVSNLEFVQGMLTKMYGEVIERAGRSVDLLARCVTELLRVPPEVLPALAEQRRMQRLPGGAGGGSVGPQGDGSGGGSGGVGAGGMSTTARGVGLSFSLPSSLSVVERLRLALPIIGSQRAAAMLRSVLASGTSSNLLSAAAAAAGGGSGGSYLTGCGGGGGASTHGSLLMRSSAASSNSMGSSTSDGVLLGMSSSVGGGSVNASLNAGGGGGWQGPGASSVAITTIGSWAGGHQQQQGGPGGGSGGGGAMHSAASSGSWMMLGGGPPAPVPSPAVVWGPGPAALGLPTLCYWLAAAMGMDALVPLRCPAAFLRELHERFQSHVQISRWLSAAEAQLRPRHRELASLQASNAALREQLETRRHTVGAERLASVVVHRREMQRDVEHYTPRVQRAMRDMEEQGAVRLVQWRRVNGLTALETLNEIRSLFARINQLQQQPHQPREPRPYGALMPQPPRMAM